MKVTFFFNHTQEGEGGEIIYFPYLNITQTMEGHQKKYLSDAAHFIGSLSSTDTVFRVLNIIKTYQYENMVRKIELANWTDSAKAIIKDNQIFFKQQFGDDYHDDLDLEIFKKIINRWHEYLLTVDKRDVEFEI